MTRSAVKRASQSSDSHPRCTATLLRVSLSPQSPVPPADGIVTDERLAALLRLAAEYDELDFKSAADLSTTRDEVEMAKDVGAMQVKGGYIVMGVDGNGDPTGGMDGANLSQFDPANLVPKMQRYLHGSLDIATGVLTRDGHTVVLLCAKPNARGCVFFKIDGQYQDSQGQQVRRFRAGEVFWRENTRSVRITMEGLEEIIERRFLARRDELLREWATAERALGSATGGSSTGTASTGNVGPEMSLSLGPDEVPATAIALMRQNDEIGLRQLLDDGRRRVRAYIENHELTDDQLPMLLDSITCLAATLLSYEREEWFERTISLLVDAYAAAGDVNVVRRLGYGTVSSPREKAPRVWLAIIERVFALGGLAVRREAWKAVRVLTIQLPAPLAEFGFDTNWLRHGLTMASRAQQFAPTTPGEPELGLIDLARDDAARLECLRSDGPSDDALLASIAQFDVLSNLVAIDDAKSTQTKVFYTNFARFRQDRVQPVVEKLLSDPEMRAEIFRGTDAQLATALAAVDHLATSQGMLYGGFHGWQGTRVWEFVTEHLPPEEGP